VSAGKFTVAVDFGPNWLDGADRWLETRVRKPGETYITLSPRQRVYATPMATLAARALSVPPGAINSSQLADGSITSAKLAPSVTASLGTPSRALLTSFDENATNLLSSGYVKIPSLSTTVGGWNSITERTAQTIQFNTSPYYISALWTGNELLVYGRNTANYLVGTRFNPTTGIWSPLPTNGAPQSTYMSSLGLVKGDSDVFVFGNIDPLLNTNSTGGIFNLVSGVWRNIPTNEFFVSGAVDTCFWTGNEVLVFNPGLPGIPPKGALYSPLTNGWRPMNTNESPQTDGKTAIGWTGAELLVYGPSLTNLNSSLGALYNPTSNTWRAVSTDGAPIGSSGHQWIYTGTELIGFVLNSSPTEVVKSRFYAYNPQSNAWRPCSTNGMPDSSIFYPSPTGSAPKLFWTGSEVGLAVSYTVGGDLSPKVAVYLYHPQTDAWRSIKNDSLNFGSIAPQWTGSEALFYMPVKIRNGPSEITVLSPFRFTPPKALYFYQRN
jgi:hypothetical protein